MSSYNFASVLSFFLVNIILMQLISSSRLHLAAWAGHAEVVSCLCKHKADVGAAAMDNTTAIHFASQKGHVEVVRELLASGASVKAKNRKGLTALHLAVQNSHLNLVKYLVKKGTDITVKTKGGQTALHVAESDDVRAFLKECEQLLKKGAETTSVKKDGLLSTTTEKAEDKSSSEVKVETMQGRVRIGKMKWLLSLVHVR
jgi:ankyrin repeat protein